MSRRFESFVMFAGMRTGSNLLEANLNAVPGLVCHGEVFNPHFVGRKDQVEMLGISLAARDRDPLILLERLRQKTEGLSGFRFFHDHDPRVLRAVLDDNRCAKVILTRNPVESYVSLKIAQATGQWKLTNPTRLKSARARFDAAEFEAHLAEAQAFQLLLLHELQVSGQTAFYLDYEDILDVAVLNGLARFLGADATIEAVDRSLKKQNPEDLADKVLNPAEMSAALARIDRFNLSRTPNFEPRRGPGIPAILIATGAPIMFLPVPGGPDLPVSGWLSAVAGHGVSHDHTQKELRQWKRANPGHRSFTVVSHPLRRAHQVFCDLVLGGRMPEVRKAIQRLSRPDGPPPEPALTLLEQHRAAFLGFLRFVRQSLTGQSALRVDPHWASQSAILQGFAAFQAPDHVLRADRLQDGLDRIAAEVGLTSPDLPAGADKAPFPLDAVWTAEIEAAAREAYARDYMAFGFTSLR